MEPRQGAARCELGLGSVGGARARAPRRRWQRRRRRRQQRAHGVGVRREASTEQRQRAPGGQCAAACPARGVQECVWGFYWRGCVCPCRVLRSRSACQPMCVFAVSALCACVRARACAKYRSTVSSAAVKLPLSIFLCCSLSRARARERSLSARSLSLSRALSCSRSLSFPLSLLRLSPTFPLALPPPLTHACTHIAGGSMHEFQSGGC